ncbi:EMB2654 [Symbiodinium sp. CCMP2592]|nr:EMB2654 [Symbiodinium sp. CCMP2592]
MEFCRVLPSATTHNVIIGALGSQRETSRALDLFDTLSSLEQEPDAITYTQAFKAHEAASQWAPPLTLLNKMCTAGTTPNVVTYGAVLSANAAVEEAGQLLSGCGDKVPTGMRWEYAIKCLTLSLFHVPEPTIYL